jgi:hypothetical protein
VVEVLTAKVIAVVIVLGGTVDVMAIPMAAAVVAAIITAAVATESVVSAGVTVTVMMAVMMAVMVVMERTPCDGTGACTGTSVTMARVYHGLRGVSLILPW